MARVETGSSDQGALDIGLAHEFAGILRFHAAAVMSPHSLACGRYPRAFVSSGLSRAPLFLSSTSVTDLNQADDLPARFFVSSGPAIRKIQILQSGKER